jgi:hypothetical protein
MARISHLCESIFLLKIFLLKILLKTELLSFSAGNKFLENWVVGTDSYAKNTFGQKLAESGMLLQSTL